MFQKVLNNFSSYSSYSLDCTKAEIQVLAGRSCRSWCCKPISITKSLCILFLLQFVDNRSSASNNVSGKKKNFDKFSDEIVYLFAHLKYHATQHFFNKCISAGEEGSQQAYTKSSGIEIQLSASVQNDPYVSVYSEVKPEIQH